jgi:nucleoside-diphosphate-sugar epimerase
MFPKSSICGETKSINRHDEFKTFGIEPKLRDDRNVDDEGSAKNLLICIPPSAAKLYDEELNESVRLWAGPASGGKLVFTSSIGIYGDSNGNTVTENFRVDSRSSRSTKLITAEELIISRGGISVRLAGLYTEQRGPHTYWLKSGKPIDGSPNGIVNMLHYADAAGSAIAALLNGKSGTVYLACDDDPITRKEICEASLESGLFPTSTMPTFELESGPIGKICDGNNHFIISLNLSNINIE